MAPVTRGGINLLIWTIVFTILDVFFVFLRFLAARLVKRKLAADDYLIIFSLTNTFALEAVLIWTVFRGGMGNHMIELSPSETTTALKSVPAAYVTWTLGTAAFKLSVLSLYIRIFSISTFRILSFVLMGLTVAYCITFLALFLTTCSPDISQLWNPRPDGYCRDLHIGQLGSVSTNLGIDVLVIILPMPFLWTLQMRVRNKIVVSFLFSLGFITIAIMIWRLVDLKTKSQADFVYHMPTLALTTELELWIGIIIACVPTLAPVLKRYVAPVITSLFGSRGSPGARPGPLSIVTFGRLGGPRRKIYTTVLYGSQDPIRDDLANGKPASSSLRLRDDAFTTTRVTSGYQGDETELGSSSAENAIYVQQDIDTYQTARTE
ncbi:uncharacterized protein GGS22DRAFT_183988 [Annulohypoxylon maeteangense]|uniref:uncharacterized protein n=1 Tax=Annulohypoxylon maeteangense TaxID=1927788 RepID=UPI002008C7F6|nr:uncharacterized protein GGS22DRAFT_183988 [Annulohypoxylon maeteangense]KAI0890643.1 hypothetical protein GGS22DRAFT_183988 [Annulohypoxylon maeteangense]